MISSFQLTRSAKLSLAHQMTPINADEEEETRWKSDSLKPTTGNCHPLLLSILTLLFPHLR